MEVGEWGDSDDMLLQVLSFPVFVGNSVGVDRCAMLI